VDEKIKYYKESISCYEIAYSKKANQDYRNIQAWSYNGLGCIYYKREQWNSAYDNFKKAYQISNKPEDYKVFKNNANNCLGVFSGATGDRYKINYLTEIKYDNPILNHPEILKKLSKKIYQLAVQK